MLRFQKFKVALNAPPQKFLNIAKICISQFHNIIKWGSPSLQLSFQHLRLILWLFLTGNTVAMVTYHAIKIYYHWLTLLQRLELISNGIKSVHVCIIITLVVLLVKLFPSKLLINFFLTSVKLFQPEDNNLASFHRSS